MTKFEEVEQLREAQEFDASTFTTENEDFRYIVDALNAAPWLLEVAGKFQKGDAKKLRNHVVWLKCSDEPESMEFIYEVIERMAEAAEIMEDLRK